MSRTNHSFPAPIGTWTSGTLFRLGAITMLMVLISLSAAFSSLAQGRPPQIPAAEYQALVDLYNATDGPHWRFQNGWQDPQATERYGVYMDENGHVTALSLSQNFLRGTLPESLTNLTQLISLSLDGNSLSGPLPSGLGKLSRLQAINLNWNGLSGSLPDSLTNLSQLVLLKLTGNALSGSIPSGFGQAGRLQTLDLSYNQMTGIIPSSLGRLTDLKQLLLNNNHFSGEVPDFSNLSGALITLQYTDLDFAPGSQSVKNIQAAIAARNEVQAGFQMRIQPAEYRALVDFYQATGGPGWYRQANWGNPGAPYWDGIQFDPDGHVAGLVLDRNNLTGPLPESLSRFSQLTNLVLPENRLSGELPATLAGLSQLQQIVLRANQFTGEIPAGLEHLPRLAVLDLGNNLISGEIPSFTGFTNLYLDLTANRLNLTPGSASLANVRALIAAGNTVLVGMLGQIPEAEYQALLDFSDLAGGISWAGWLDPQAPQWAGVTVEAGHVTALDLENLRLSTVPGSLTNLSQLNSLNLSYNALTAIPAELGSLSQLQQLILPENLLAGTIPPSLGELAHLVKLDLSHNLLSGEVPLFPDFRNASLRFDFNHLDLSVGSATRANIKTMEAAGNQIVIGFEARIPAEEYQALLDLFNVTDGPHWHGNSAWGSQSTFWEGIYYAPSSAGDYHVVQISLPRHNLRGPLPESLGQLTELQYLDLSGNSLAGSIPAAMGRLPNLRALNLSNNPLSGDAPYFGASRGAVIILSDTQINLEPGSVSRANLLATIAAGNYVDAGMRLLISPAEYQALVDLYNATDGPNWDDFPASDWLNPNKSHWEGLSTQSGHVVALSRSRRRLHGQLPVSLGELTQLQALDLSGNQIIGPLPESLTNLTRLDTLNLARNGLTGRVPAGLGNWLALTHLDLSSNLFEGDLPENLDQLVRLQELVCAKNQFKGTIPANLGTLTNLIRLNLADNQLTGTIPDGLGRLAQLHYLDLSTNRLSGSIPDALGDLRYLFSLSLAHNQLSGDIPVSLGQLPNLQALELDHNLLSGDLAGLNFRYRSIILSFNDFDFAPGTPALANLKVLIGAGNNVVFAPQNAHGAPFLGLRAVDNMAVLSWPLASAGFKLETSATPEIQASWTTVADYNGSFSLGTWQDGLFELMVKPPPAGAFFRLHQP